MISVQNLTKKFGQKNAVDDVSFTVNESETLVLLGTSGCGKTTTLRMINRLVEPTSGEISIDGKNIYLQPAEKLRRSIGYVLQHHGLFPHYTVEENISVVPKLMQWPKEKIKNRVQELLHKLQLPPDSYANLYPDQLSGGQQQRVGLARALAAGSPVLLMDEPFGALDPITRASVTKEFMQLDELKRKTIILVTHDVSEAFTLGDRICLMDGGKVVQIGSPQELLFRPANEFVKNFFNQQRLQLELTAVRLDNILPYLPTTNDTQTTTTIEGSETLWSAMEALSGGNQQELINIKDAKGEVRKTGLEALMAAFHQYKKQL